MKDGNAKPTFLFVTANAHETDALLKDREFFAYRSDVRSKDPEDVLYYNVGTFGAYNAVHFELPEQGSARADSSFASIHAAMTSWNPVGVILVGIAFGKDNETTAEPRQHIGDVLISTRVIDYESGKIRNGRVHSDGSQPDAGRVLLSAFKHRSKTWEHRIHERKTMVEFGPILSGDKVVDDSEFKKQLFDQYPRAIGGEMEGRGAYAAARRKAANEWLVVKAICDWGENKQNPDKEADQVAAARSAASLVRHVFSSPDTFSKLVPNQVGDITAEVDIPPEPIGYCVNVGTTSCRLFEIRGDQTLKELQVVPYDISDVNDDRYLDGITQLVRTQLLPRINEDSTQLFLKVFVDVGFNEIFDSFEDPSRRTDFIRDFYQQTNLYFNVVSKRQTEENLRRLFLTVRDDTAIVNIDSQGADILHITSSEIRMHRIQIPLRRIQEFVAARGFPDVWTESNIDAAKSYIREALGDQLGSVRVDNAIIIKDELRFMTDHGYGLKLVNGNRSLSQFNYKKANRERLFGVDFRAQLEKKHGGDDASIRRIYGFRYGHLLIETILEAMHNKLVIPKDDLTIHGDHLNAYIFNVVLTGSTHEGRHRNIVNAHELIGRIGVNVLSPLVMDGELSRPISADSEFDHLKAIDECDVLFVCNQSDAGYIGEATKCEIYYAYALKKTIAFWVDPPDDSALSFIPRERWGAIETLIPKSA